MAVYPYLPKLQCFQDRSLYLSLLPLDILEYCLRPLLNWCHPQVQCAEKWISPRLVQTLTLPMGFSYRNATTMTNGNLIVLCSWGRQMKMLDFSTGRILWEAEELQIQHYMYNDQDDILVFQMNTTKGGISYQLTEFSRIGSLEEFLMALVGSESKEPYSVVSQTWKQRSIDHPPAYVSKIKEMIKSLSISPSTIKEGFHRGGYLLLTLQTSDYPQEIIQVYQCLE